MKIEEEKSEDEPSQRPGESAWALHQSLPLWAMC
jgi:hypothetical protein